jgi:hypothetical protein
MASLDELLQQLGFGGVTRNRAGQIVGNTNDVIPVATAGLADTLYGAGRGTLAGTAAIGGIPGDINQMYVNKFGALFPSQPAPPTSEQISQAVRKAVPPLNLSIDNTGRIATSLGENVVSPMIAPEALIGAAKATKGLPVGMSIQDVSKNVPSNYVPNVMQGEEMLVMHNISPSKLQYADKLGGLPVPSLGIGKTGSPYSSFGDITLIAPKEFAQPSAKNPVFRSDAYTSRFPNINYQFDKKAEKAFDTVFASVKEQIPTDLKYRVSDATTDWKYRGDSAAFKYKFLEEKGLLPNKQEYPKGWDFNNEARDRVNKLSDEYSAWLGGFEQRLQDSGVVPKEKIYKGETYSGTRRYAEANLDNLVKEMKGGAGGENWNYGVGNVRAVASPKFKNLKEIQANRGLLEDTQSINKLKDKTDAAYSDLLGKLREYNSRYDANDAMLEIAQTKNLSVLDREYGGVPDQLKANISTFLDGFKTMPTEYFEVKPQRAVGIEEFSGAIIPKDAPKSVKDILSKRGITEVYEYATPEERAGLMQKFGKEMFAAAPVGGGLLAGQDQLELKKEKKPKK